MHLALCLMQLTAWVHFHHVNRLVSQIAEVDLQNHVPNPHNAYLQQRLIA